MSLHERARAAGVQIAWTDAIGVARRVGDDTLRAVLAALGEGAPSPLTFRGGAGGGASRPGVASEATTHPNPSPEGEGLFTCPSVHVIAGRPRIWGAAAQIYSLRDTRSTAFGDFTTLAATATALGRVGADALAISPTHALFPADPSRYSPYAASSRLFHNIIYADPALVGAPAPPRPGPALIDWASGIPARRNALRAAWADAPDALREAVAAFRAAGGEALERHARFDALHARFLTGWHGWPAAYHDPNSEAVARFAAEHADEIAFYAFAQRLADEGLAEAQAAAKRAGMAVGLIADLAIGVDAGGSQAWSARDELLTGLSLGAPPDLFNPKGQNWGLTGFSPAALRRSGCAPFTAVLRAALRHAGGVRIDHALGLNRLWVIPDGASAAEGAYLTMPQDALLAVIAAESRRANAIVIGEDLGTIPPGLREAMSERGLLGMRVLQFEQGVRPDDYPPATVAMTGTHDLPTIAGWWTGRDLEWARRLGRQPSTTREADKRRLWAMFQAAGVAQGQLPHDPAPAVDAALAFCAATSSTSAILPLEDLTGELDQPNIPGTTTEHPNWRRRMAAPTADLLAEPAVAARTATLSRIRMKEDTPPSNR